VIDVVKSGHLDLFALAKSKFNSLSLLDVDKSEGQIDTDV
jgi:hypothetical protein